SNATSCTPSSRAALASWAWFGFVLGSANTAIRRACGANSCRISSRLTSSSGERMLTPVMLPPGRAMLAASPLPTMSSAMPTMGIVWVARCTARRVREGDDYIDILRDELLGQRRRALVAALGPNEQESNVTSVFPADCPHIAPERFDELIDVLRGRPQYPDHRQAALLRARRERPRRHAPEQPA